MSTGFENKKRQYNIPVTVDILLGEKGIALFHALYYGRISEIIFNAWILDQ